MLAYRLFSNHEFKYLLHHKASNTNYFAKTLINFAVPCAQTITILLLCLSVFTIKIWWGCRFDQHITPSSTFMVTNQQINMVSWFNNIKTKACKGNKMKLMINSHRKKIFYKSVEAVYCLSHPFQIPAPFLPDAHPVMNISPSLPLSLSVLRQGDTECTE